MKAKVAIAALLLPLAVNGWCLVPHANWFVDDTLTELTGNLGPSAVVVVPVKTVQPKQTSSDSKETQATKSPAKLISVADLLKGASNATKLEFLESLVLVDGKVASAKLDGLTQDLGEVKMKEVVATLTPQQAPVYKMNSDMRTMALCGEHVCYDSACRNHNCVDKQGYGCFDSCH